MKARSADMRIAAIVPSAGKGKRFGGDNRKPFAKLAGKPLVAYALSALQSCGLISDIVLVVDGSLRDEAKKLVRDYGITKVSHIVGGGRTRAQSVKNGLKAVSRADYVLIHDGARPFITEDMIEKAVRVAIRYGAAVTAVPLKSTVKFFTKNGYVDHTPRRDFLREVQTPQVFRRNLIEKGYSRVIPAGKGGAGLTDDSLVLELAGIKARLVAGSYRNIKITTADDMTIAAAFLKKAARC